MIVVFIYDNSIVSIMIFTFVSALGDVYIADQINNRIRKVTVSTGIITTIAGTGSSGYSGDNGVATSATLNKPSGVTLDSSGTQLHLLTYSFTYLLLAQVIYILQIAATIVSAS